MARVSSILQAGLSAASARPVEVPVPVRLDSDENLVETNAEKRSRVNTAGMPNDLVPALAAGAGMGFVFGPVGALLGAGLAHHFASRERQGIEAYALAQEQNREDVFKQSRSALSGAYERATTEDERAEVAMMQDELENLYTLSSSPDMKTSLGAIIKAQELSGTLDEQFDDWQAERLAAQKVIDERVQTWETQTSAMRNRNFAESSSYIDGARQWENLKALLDKDDISKVDGTAAIFSFAKLVNPGEITTDGDISVLSAGGGLSSQLAARLNEVILGNAFMDETIAAEMLNAGAQLMGTLREEQLQRNESMQQLASDFGIPDEIRRNISVPINAGQGDLVPRPVPQPPGADPSVGPIGQIYRDAAGLFLPEGGLNSPAPIFEDAKRSLLDWYSGSGRDKRRERNRRPTN